MTIDTMEDLIGRVEACFACTSMSFSHVLGAGNGKLDPDVVLIGEAPGRRGAARSGVPFLGDESGKRFDAFLALAGLSREEVFVTNAVLCNPLDKAGRNRPPSANEVGRCLPFLAEQLRLLKPRLVVTLGSVALRALGRLEAHNIVLSRDAGQEVAWRRMSVVALYHPGRQSTLHRPQLEQEDDWRRLGSMVRAVRER